MHRHILINLIALTHSCMHIDPLRPFLSPNLMVAAQHLHSLLGNLDSQLWHRPAKQLVGGLVILAPRRGDH